MRWEKWSILDLFRVHGWPYRAKNGVHVLWIFPLFLVFFVYLLTIFTPCFQPVLLSIFMYFFIFYYKKAQHSTQHTQNTTTHTCTPATDRDLESGLSTSHTRKTRENAWKRQSQGNLWQGLVPILTGKSFVCGKVAKDGSNHLVAGSLRSFPRFQGKSAWLEESTTCCSRPILKLLMDKNPMVTPGEPLEQVITPRGPFMVSLNLTMRDEPNIGLRSCMDCSKIPWIPDKKCEVLSRETLFHLIGPLMNERSYSVKQCFSG